MACVFMQELGERLLDHHFGPTVGEVGKKEGDPKGIPEEKEVCWEK